MEGQAAVWEVGYASAGERTLSGSTAGCDTRAPHAVKAEKGAFRKRESEICVFTFVTQYNNLFTKQIADYHSNFIILHVTISF